MEPEQSAKLSTGGWARAVTLEDQGVEECHGRLLDKLRFRLQDVITSLLVDKTLPIELQERVCIEVERLFFFGIKDGMEIWDLFERVISQQKGTALHRCFQQVAMKRTLQLENNNSNSNSEGRVGTPIASLFSGPSSTVLSVLESIDGASSQELTNYHNGDTFGLRQNSERISDAAESHDDNGNGDDEDAMVERFRRRLAANGTTLVSSGPEVTISSEKSRRARATLRAALNARAPLRDFLAAMALDVKIRDYFHPSALCFTLTSTRTGPTSNASRDLVESLLSALMSIDFTLEIRTADSLQVPTFTSIQTSSVGASQTVAAPTGRTKVKSRMPVIS